ncbi:MAG: response regulator [Deltaproteobacteria bacterium]|nr:response regulator [Deltaproteobacteria bacterium]
MARILIVDDNMDLGALLANAFSERGHSVTLHLLGRDALSAVQTTPLDAAIVDLHLPDIRGTEVLAALKSANVPSVAISGVFRGFIFDHQMKNEFGAKAMIEKPFELTSLVTLVEGLLPGAIQRPATPVEPPELALGEDVDVDPVASGTAEAAQAVASEREAMARKRAALDDLPFSGRKVWGSGSDARPATGQQRAIASLGPQAAPLANTSVPRLLAAAHQGKLTGELRLKRGQVVKVIWLDAGRPIYAASNVAAERFGRHAVAKGILTADDLLTVQELAAREQVKTGEAMVRLGLLSADTRSALLHDQALQIIASTFEWPDGEHQFISRKVGKADVMPLALSLPAVMLAGFLRVPLVKLRDRLPRDKMLSPAPDPVFELHQLELSPAQARLVMAADGTKTVEDLVSLADMEEREALALLEMLLELRVIEPRASSANKRIVLV